jgi:anthranilate synthase component 1
MSKTTTTTTAGLAPSPFDIPADLDTPVSAYLKLRSLGPRFLLESVDGGQLGRYSFIGFGETLELRLEAGALRLRGSNADERHALPESQRGDAGGRHAPPGPSFARGDFLHAVERARGHIGAGDVYQLVLSIRFEGETDLSPFGVYRALRLLNPSPYMVFLDFGDLQVVGSSPEALVRLEGRRAFLRPIAGTRHRGGSDAEDRALEGELLADPKEAAEHVMLVDLARDAFDVFAAAFPAGSVVGARKIRAIELIDELKPVRRGLYAGTLGYFGHGGGMDQAITIRTITFRDGGYAFQAGAGIVADSVPEREHDEIGANGAALEAALALAEEGL